MRRLLGSSHGSHRKAKDKILALRLHLHRLMESPALASPNYIEQHRDIPEEIVVEILSRLPVKSLLRFKCVSKLWQSLISDPTFTLSSSRRKHRIAIRAAPCNSIEWKHRAAIRSAPFDSISAEEALSRCPPLLPEPMIFNNNNKDDNGNIEGWMENMQILGSCNGLLLASHRTDLYLWNPTTRQCTKMLSLRTDWPSYHYLFVDPSGLCYDSYSDDYKAVFVDNGSATIISFRRRIWNSTICSFAKMYGSGLVVNGKLHWVIRSPRLNQVAYFDPLTDEFLELPLPVVPNNGNYDSIILRLGVLDGCLCMTRRLVTTLGGRGLDFDFHPGFIGEGKHGSIEVLLMKEHGVVESWSRVFIMSDRMQSSYWSMGRSPYSVCRILMPLCFTKDGEVLLSVDGNKLLVYRPDKMSQRHIKIERHRDIFYVASYEESLASPAAYGHGHEEDWIVEAPDALKLLHNISGYWSDYYHGDYVDRDDHVGDYVDRDDHVDSEILNSTKEDSSIKEVDRSSEEEEEEEEDSVPKGCWKKEEDQEKFSRREKARLYYISAKEKKHKTRTRDKSKIRRVRKNERKKKRGKNLEVEDLHKQVIDFSVK